MTTQEGMYIKHITLNLKYVTGLVIGAKPKRNNMRDRNILEAGTAVFYTLQLQLQILMQYALQYKNHISNIILTMHTTNHILYMLQLQYALQHINKQINTLRATHTPNQTDVDVVERRGMRVRAGWEWGGGGDGMEGYFL